MDDKAQTGNDTDRRPGLMGAQQQACGLFTAVRTLENVRMRARDAGDFFLVEKLSNIISTVRATADFIIDREHNPHAGLALYAPSDAKAEGEGQ